MPRAVKRGALAVRKAAPGDVPELHNLVAELRESGGRASRPLLRETHALNERLSELIGREDITVLVAELQRGVVGMAVLSDAPLSTLTDVKTLRMDYVIVTRRLRRKGVGRALVAAAAAYADEWGLQQVAVATVPADRETNRFFARLGFAPVIVRRATTTAALQRKLAGTERRTVVEDLARRRLLGRPDPAVRRAVRGATGRG